MKKNLSKMAYIIHIIGLILVFKVKAFGQTSYELQCKSQAKEVALQTYQTCVTENRQQQIDSLRKEYQAKLNELKEHYNRELKKAAGKETDANAPSAQPAPANPLPTKDTDSQGTITLKPAKKSLPAVKMGKAEKPLKGIAKNLPSKKFNNGPALPTQNVSADTPVVPAAEPTEPEVPQMDSDSNVVIDPSIN
jgi:hypothetical protein